MKKALTILLVFVLGITANISKAEEPKFHLDLDNTSNSEGTDFSLDYDFTLFPSEPAGAGYHLNLDLPSPSFLPFAWDVGQYDPTLPLLQTPRERPNQTYMDFWKNPVGIPAELTLQEEIMANKYSSLFGLGLEYPDTSTGVYQKITPDCRNLLTIYDPPIQEDCWLPYCAEDYIPNPRNIIGGFGGIIIRNARQKVEKKSAKAVFREPHNLEQKLALKDVKSNSSELRTLDILLNDNDYKGMNKVQKYYTPYRSEPFEIHAVRDPATGAVTDYKFIQYLPTIPSSKP